MKTLRSISLLIIALLTISSCTTDEYYNDVYEETWHVEDLTVLGSHWNLVGNPNDIGSYYEYVFDGVPLDVSYYQGVVTAYMYFGYKTPNEIQTPLPYTEYKHYINGDGEDAYYSIQYSYDVKANGTISFKIYVSDYFTGDFTPSTQDFRIAIVW